MVVEIVEKNDEEKRQSSDGSSSDDDDAAGGEEVGLTEDQAKVAAAAGLSEQVRCSS